MSGMIAASVLLFSPVAFASPIETRSSLAEAVEQENWSLAISLVDRLIDEQGAERDLLDYRSHLQRLNTSSLLAEVSNSDASLGQLSVTPSEADLARELALERQRQAEWAAREERLAAREIRREQRNQERMARAEARYLRALERESLARTNAINANQSRRIVCLASTCGYRHSHFRGHHRSRRRLVYSERHEQHDRSGEVTRPAVRLQIN